MLSLRSVCLKIRLSNVARPSRVIFAVGVVTRLLPRECVRKSWK